MTKDEIKKALECCTNWESCPGCPYFCSYRNCSDIMQLDALNLITEQEEEIELLKMQMKAVVNHARTFLEEEQKLEAENVKLKAEIERLKENLKNLKDDFESLQKDYEFVRDCDAEHCLEIEETVKQAKIDVLNKLRKECGSVGVIALTDHDIDKMIEELKK